MAWPFCEVVVLSLVKTQVVPNSRKSFWADRIVHMIGPGRLGRDCPGSRSQATQPWG